VGPHGTAVVPGGIFRAPLDEAARSRVPPVAYGSVELWPDEYQAWMAGRRIALTQREFQVLHVLVANGGHVVRKRRIHDAVWGPHHSAGPRDRSVDVHVRKLRRKFLDVAPDWRFIHTHFGVGYRFDPEPAPGRR
jgi:DNA-binding response OmpR family regulator